MFGIDNLKISLTFSPFLFFLAIIFFVAFTIFIYRFTVPDISNAKKVFLIVVRSLTLSLVLLSIFEPTLTLIKRNVLKPITLFFIDNSKSILVDDGSEKDKMILNVVKQLEQNDLIKNTHLKTFGSKVSQLSSDSLNNISFTEGSTNFSNIFKTITDNTNNISSVVILSDGVITDGINPIYSAEKVGIPVFTMGIGDTAKLRDIEIKSVLYNEFIYAETSTSLTAAIINNGFANRNVSLSFYENDVLLEQQNIQLSVDGIQNVRLTYTPKTSGEKKLTLALSNLEGERTKANNRKVFYLNVLSNKVKVLLLAGNPSSDLSFIKNTLLTDNNLSVNSITQIGVNKYLEKNNREKLLDSADVLIFIGFPSKETSQDLLNKTASLNFR